MFIIILIIIITLIITNIMSIATYDISNNNNLPIRLNLWQVRKILKSDNFEVILRHDILEFSIDYGKHFLVTIPASVYMTYYFIVNLFHRIISFRKNSIQTRDKFINDILNKNGDA